MGNRRKAKGIQSLKRRNSNRPQYLKVLVICEGEKTEPYYFEEPKRYYHLPSAIIEICSSRGSDLWSLFTFAQERYHGKAEDTGDPFNQVYCVFDKDEHNAYRNTLEAIRKASPRNTFEAIHSVPCFEYWLLLHFTYTTKPYYTVGRKECVSASGNRSEETYALLL